MKEIVSVAVITYNSSQTVVETLDSIVNQSYGTEFLELIISDDCSTDNTVEVISEWLTIHQDKFQTVNFIKNPVNGGVSANCNKAWKECLSKWIKTIAGDDILKQNCIKTFITFLLDKPDVKIIFGVTEAFSVIEGENITNLILPSESESKRFYSTDNAKKQLSYLLCNGGLSGAPASFVQNSLLQNVGYCDEQYKMIEDFPLWIKILKVNVPFYFINEGVVQYRVGESISNSSASICNLQYVKNLIDINKIEYKKSNHLKEMFFIGERIIRLKKLLLMSKVFENKKTKKYLLLNKITNVFFVSSWMKFIKGE